MLFDDTTKIGWSNTGLRL